jgi:hypothetical protein
MRNSSSSFLALAALAALAGNAVAQNDDCAGAVPVTLGLNGPFTNVGATTSTPAWPCGAGANDIWFSFTAPTAGTLIVDTCTGTTYDSTVQVFNGAAGCGSLVSLGCNDDFCGLQSQLSVNVAAGPLFIRVGGFAGSTGTFSLSVSLGTVSATNTTLGTGCISIADVSSYEYFATAAGFDLGNSGITMIHTGTGYLALPLTTAYVPPSGSAQVLALSDDSEATVTLSQPMPVGNGSLTNTLVVCSNGFISAASGNFTGFTPNASTFLNGAQTWWSVRWHDYNPSIAGSGQVKFEQIGNIAYVTWDGVWDYTGTSAANANTFQAQFDVTTGSVSYVYQTLSGLGNGVLVGFSDAGASADPGSIDISALLPATFSAATFGVRPLTLAATTRPITGTSWNLDTTNVPSSATIGIEVFGLSDPNIADLGFLGAPGCGSRASLDVLNVWLVGGQVTHAYSLAIPSNPALLNLHVFTQAVALKPGVNTLLGGTITSNGIDGGIGDY